MDTKINKHDEKTIKIHRASILNHKAQANVLGLTSIEKRCEELLKLVDSGSYNLEILEILNHSMYKPTFEVDITEYIADDKEAYDRLVKALRDAQGGDISLLISDTGTGKGYALAKALKENKDIYAIIILPNTSIVEQMGETYKLPYMFGRRKRLDDLIGRKRVIVTTWDKLSQARSEELSKYIIVRDEAHELNASDFRNRVVRLVEQIAGKSSSFVKGVVDITATPTRLDFTNYKHIIKFNNKIKQKVDVTMYDGISDDKILELVANKKRKFAVLIDDKKRLRYLQKLTDRKSGVIYTDTTDAIRPQLVKTSELGDYEGLFTTRALLAGFNIEGEKEATVIIEGIKDPQLIKQFPARIRGAKISYHIFNNYPKEAKYFTHLKNKIAYSVEKLERTVAAINEIHKNEDGTVEENTGLKLNSENGIYYCKLQSKFVVDKAQVTANIYDDYYKTRSLAQLKELISEYFDDIKVVSLDEKEKDVSNFKEFVKLDEKGFEKALLEIEGQKENYIATIPIVRNMELTDNQKHSLAMLGKSQDELRILHKLSKTEDKLQNTSIEDFLIEFSNYHTDNNYDIDFAFGLTKLKKAKRDIVLESINVIKYRTKMETSKPKRLSLEERQIQFMIDELPIGTKYGAEQLDELTRRFNSKFKTNYKSTKIKNFINSIFVLNEKRTKTTKKDAKLYRNFSSEQKDIRFNVNQIKGYLAISDIAEQLGVDTSNTTLNKLLSL